LSAYKTIKAIQVHAQVFEYILFFLIQSFGAGDWAKRHWYNFIWLKGALSQKNYL